ncbi:MAG: thiamine phosphate synthase [Chromatiales bacterium]|nr:thiamine phosphate synthase [Chromatiales bacterium]
MKLEGLYLIADSTQLTETNTGDYIADLIEAGVSIVQLRDKNHHAAAGNMRSRRYRLARIIQAKCRIYNIPFIINDDVSLALEIDADGVHLGQDDMAVRKARQYLGADKYIGVSCYASKQRALQAQQDGADYVAFGALFNSPTKPQAQCLGSSVEQSLKVLQQLSGGINVPICSIGGITPDKAKLVLRHGAQIIAVASGILKAVDARQAIRQYRTAWL